MPGNLAKTAVPGKGNGSPGPKIVFDITKVSRVFEIVPTVADAKF